MERDSGVGRRGRPRLLVVGRGLRALAVTLGWLLLMAPLAVLTLRALPSQSWYPAAQLVGLLPWTWPLAVIACALGLAARRTRGSRTLLAVGLAVVIGMGVLIGPRATGSSDRAHGPVLRVMALNTYFGGADADVVVDTVESQSIDVLCLSEYTPGLERLLEADGLRTRLPYLVSHAQPGTSGMAIWSRTPLTEVTPVDGGGFRMPRAVVDIDGTSVTVTCVHAFAPRRDEISQWGSDLASVGATVHATAGAQVVLGDFNATWDHSMLRRLARTGSLHDAAQSVGAGLVPTWPTRGEPVPWPVFTLDHVLTTLAVRDASTVDVPGTDHRGIRAILDLRATSVARSQSLFRTPWAKSTVARAGFAMLSPWNSRTSTPWPRPRPTPATGSSTSCAPSRSSSWPSVTGLPPQSWSGTAPSSPTRSSTSPHGLTP